MSETLSQRNPRWAAIRLGWGKNNKTTIGSHGCTVTCIAMLAELTPDEVNRRFIEHKVYVEGQSGVFNLVNWTRIHLAIPWLKFQWRGYAYEKVEIKLAADKNGICLVEVDFDGIIATPNDRHWVGYIGNKQIRDPYTWPKKDVEPTAKYPLWKGYTIINKIGNAPEKENMNELLEYLGMPNVAAAKRTLKGHLGGKDKCEWGSEDAAKGGHLGSARRRAKQLEAQPAEVKEIEVIKEVIVEKEGFPKEVNGLKLDSVTYKG